MSEERAVYTVVRSDFTDAELRSWWTESYRENRLLRNTFFQSWEWNSLWYEFYVRDDVRRELVLLRVAKGGSIVCAVPLFLQKRAAGPILMWQYLLWIADRLGQYPDAVTTETQTASLWSAIVDFLHREYPGAWLRLNDTLPDSTVTALSIPQIETLQGEPYLRLRLAAYQEDDFVSDCAAHMRREIKRARQLMTKNPQLQWQAYRAPGQEFIEKLIQLNRLRFGASSWFADEVSTNFFRSLCREIGTELLITVVFEDGDPIHLLAAYLHGGTVHYVLSGMDEGAKRWSPGTMNLDRTICWAMENGFDYFDFLRGDEAYKREFNPEERTGSHITIPPASGNARSKFVRALQRGRKAADRV